MAEENQSSDRQLQPLTPQEIEQAQWPLSRAVTTATLAAMAGAASVVTAALFGLGLIHHLASSTSAVLDVVKLAFALVAGVGGSIGLVLAYRRHKIAEAAVLIDKAKEAREARKEAQEGRRDEREVQRAYNERFGAAAAQLGSDLHAVRIAGVYAMAQLADDWAAGRQQCIDVLCGMLRHISTTRPNDGTPEAELPPARSDNEFRHTIIRIIAAKLRAGSWSGQDFDFTGVLFDGGFDLGGARLTGSITFAGALFRTDVFSFKGAHLDGGSIDFTHAAFDHGCRIDFLRAEIKRGGISFTNTHFAEGSTVNFEKSKLAGGTLAFESIVISGGRLTFFDADFTGTRTVIDGQLTSGIVSLAHTRFISGSARFTLALHGGDLVFNDAQFQGGTVSFERTDFAGGRADFIRTELIGGEVEFGAVAFHGTEVSFRQARFPYGAVRFTHARFQSRGSVTFEGAEFNGAEVDFRKVSDWTHPPIFDSGSQLLRVPQGVLLPTPASGPSTPRP